MVSPETVNELDQMDNLEFERRTFDAILHELGSGGLARFLMTYRSGKGDYTSECHQWLDKVTLEDSERELLAEPGV